MPSSESPPSVQSPTPDASQSPAADANQSSTVDANQEESARGSTSLRNVGVSLLLSLLVLGVIAYFTFDAAAFREVVGHLRPLLLLAAVGIAFARIGLNGWRLSYVSQGRLSLRSGTRGQLAWDFFSSVTPSIVGGGPIAAFYVARDQNIPVGEAAAFMFFCILLDQLWFVVAIPLLIVANLYVDLLPAAAGTVGLWGLMAYFGVLLAWAAVHAYATLFRPRLLLRLARWCVKWPYLRWARTRVMEEVRSYVGRARTLGAQSPSFYVNGFLLTGLSWGARYGLVVLIVRSVYANVDALSLLFRSAAMMLVGLIMPTPGGSGGVEGLYALFIGPLIPASLVAPTLLTWRLLSYYLFIALGAYLFMHQLRDRSSSASPAPSPPSS
jgi:uncharacterized protein (TIRG00374 family)